MQDQVVWKNTLHWIQFNRASQQIIDKNPCILIQILKTFVQNNVIINK